MHIHWRKFDHKAGVNRYFQCRCGSRKVLNPISGGREPIDRHWLETGERMREPRTGPTSPSGCSSANPRMEPPPDFSWVTFDELGP